ncbi:MAG: acyltransferase 3 [Gemmatimonadetes bacterium]|nr:acyltransferase 3 [Gemmatimonadota bacterium]
MMESRLPFRADIEGLRGVAVLMVVLFHVDATFATGGFLGVDVFFVLSGFLITGLLVREHFARGRIGLADFYARRARRILPAATLVLAGSVLASMRWHSPVEQARLAPFAVATAAFVGNVLLVLRTGFYAAPYAGRIPVLQAWSLSVEEQFYLAWPLLIIAVLALLRTTRGRCTALAAVGLASLLAAMMVPVWRPMWIFYLTPFRVWEFSLGALVAFRVPGGSRSTGAWAVAGGLGLIAVLGSVFLPVRFPSPWVNFPAVAGTALLLASGATAPGSPSARLLSMRWLRLLGRWSYSWYLLHWPALVFAQAIRGDLSLPARIACVVVTLPLAALLERYVERPAREHPSLRSNTRRSLALGGALVVAGLLVATAGLARARYLTRSASQQSMLRASAQREPSFFDGCIPREGDARVRACLRGDTGSGVRVVVVGDSHATQWELALDRMARERHWQLVLIAKAACPILRVEISNPLLGTVEKACGAWREEALRKSIALHPALVIIATNSGYVATPYYSGGYAQVTGDQWRRGLASILFTLDSAGIHVAYLRDTPNAGFDVPSCLSRALYRRGTVENRCMLQREYVVNPTAGAAEDRVLAVTPGVTLIDLNDRFCGPVFCLPIAEGVVRYRDSGHANGTFLLTLEPDLGRAVALAIGRAPR